MTPCLKSTSGDTVAVTQQNWRLLLVSLNANSIAT